MPYTVTITADTATEFATKTMKVSALASTWQTEEFQILELASDGIEVEITEPEEEPEEEVTE